jgi:hypothetical protein
MLSPQKVTRSKTVDDSGLEDNTPPKLLKVGECLYRRAERGKFYAIIKRQGKQFRRCLQTTDRKLAERKLAVLSAKIRNTNAEISHGLTVLETLPTGWFEAVKDQYKVGSAKRRKLCIKQLKPLFAKVPLKMLALVNVRIG